MDPLLIPFYGILLGIVLSPFLLIRFVEHSKTSDIESEKSELINRREVILENLRDIKIEFDTGKLTESEFHSISSGIVKDLEDFDEKIRSATQNIPKPANSSETIPKFCHKCGFKIAFYGAKFCPSCGTKLLI
ncbi:zinc ribbon domain-containing protein [Leptospira interrogans]|uniref:Zinc-ribbon domain protein n=6 Tax=Leptospira interrogans TaxID=173 RepID=M7A9J3_LEPIR|nr:MULTISPECIES: zinc ribbon domain-containing protein [Leptospira]EMG12018.1 zinc-ribbon domain protein [Leptospira interrogans serovar Grippotyphosa str. LT2186]EMN32087.1 zinc-ribbon domain protein [Leptospira interrogans serovar Pyrogenes str. L0374]EMP07444.1 zinc-ribbon domain protein [Leptospira interrogans serovar Pyrogenes str. 200701872]ASV06460.1 zinc ribbon domain-containing protein [Leptospira interrogans serovar Canicola]EJO79227.1 zinc-ribbon domain protein [Leptospira interroga